MAKSRKKTETFSVDELMSNTAFTLVSDFQSNLQDPCFCSDLQRAFSAGDIARIRELEPAVDDQMDVARYKATYQMASIVKRYRYRTDIYSDQELERNAIEAFLQTQDRLANVDLSQTSEFTSCVLDLAARYVAETLGPYNDEECRDLCRFGRKASVGIPARLACEAARWELPMTGSSEQIDWFDSEMGQIESVLRYWDAQKAVRCISATYQESLFLTLSLVPKSYKSLRAIMPNTTIGSYMSYGLGEIMRKRLKTKGYDIRTLQERHRILARRASVHGKHVTADLSSASDSITVALVERLFPKDWFDILNRSRIGSVVTPDLHFVNSLTFCTMGIGYTFPLQTLVFLSLLHAIRTILFGRSDRRTISVYGDDMIYATRMHDFVVRVFSEIGFVINVDKTFVTGRFRESCGGDYYHGVDVRPFQPRNGSASVGKRTYEAMLYKFINGLLMRWNEHEIGRTLNYLMSQVELVTGKAKVVPGNYPDDSGVKLPRLKFYDFIETAKYCKPKHLGHGVFRFPYLRLQPEERKEDRHEPYLWLRLRGVPVPIDYSLGAGNSEPSSLALSVINLLTGVDEEHEPSLLWRNVRPTQTTRSTLTGRRLRRQASFVTVSHTGRYTRQSGTSCFEDRRL